MLEEGEGNTAESQAQKRLKKIEKTFNDLIKNPPGDVKDAVCEFSFPVKEDCSDLDFSSSEEEDEIVCSYVDSVRLEGRESSNKSTSSKKKQSKNEQKTMTINWYSESSQRRHTENKLTNKK